MDDTSSSSSTAKKLLFPERLNIIYDSKCSVCRWEVEFLDSVQKSNQQQQQQSLNTLPIRFTDLESTNGYDSTLPSNGGITYAQGMKSFHAVTSDGRVLHGVQVFREAYELVGLGWLWNWTVDAPWMGKVANVFYDLFARYRTDITRGSPVLELIRQYEEEGRTEAVLSFSVGEKKDVSCRSCEEKFADTLTNKS